MSVWILDGVVWHSQLLPFVLTRETLPHTTVLLVADLSQPWGILESLERWAQVVRKHVSTLNIPPKELKDMEDKSESLCTLLLLCCFLVAITRGGTTRLPRFSN